MGRAVRIGLAAAAALSTSGCYPLVGGPGDRAPALYGRAYALEDAPDTDCLREALAGSASARDVQGSWQSEGGETPFFLDGPIPSTDAQWWAIYSDGRSGFPIALILGPARDGGLTLEHGYDSYGVHYGTAPVDTWGRKFPRIPERMAVVEQELAERCGVSFARVVRDDCFHLSFCPMGPSQ